MPHIFHLNTLNIRARSTLLSETALRETDFSSDPLKSFSSVSQIYTNCFTSSFSSLSALATESLATLVIVAPTSVWRIVSIAWLTGGIFKADSSVFTFVSPNPPWYMAEVIIEKCNSVIS